MKAQKYVAELLGTYTLTLAVALSLALDMPLATPVIAGLTLGLFVYTIGSISGSHLNPAVSVAMLTLGKINVRDTILYALFQVGGALLALLTSQYLLGADLELAFNDTTEVALAESIGAFFFVFGVAAVVLKKVNAAASGVVIGGSLLLGILLTGGFSLGVLNPAVAIGLGSESIIYVLAPILGGFLGAQMYYFVQSK